MKPLRREDLWSLEEYAVHRADFRERVIAHKKRRQVTVGEHARLCFEDVLTVKYQIQEMLRIERVFEPDGIQDELDAYNPLIPDGSNWKVTLMLEYQDIEERKVKLAELIGVEEKVWLAIEDFEPLYAVCNEDLDRTAAGKTSSVHFLRYELTPAMVEAVKGGVAISAGIAHPRYPNEPVMLPAVVCASLAGDLA